MSKYIIDKESLQELIKKYAEKVKYDTSSLREFENIIYNIDLGKIVYCKDCKHWRSPSKGSLYNFPYCSLCYGVDGLHCVRYDKDFCSYGTREKE